MEILCLYFVECLLSLHSSIFSLGVSVRSRHFLLSIFLPLLSHFPGSCFLSRIFRLAACARPSSGLFSPGRDFLVPVRSSSVFDYSLEIAFLPVCLCSRSGFILAARLDSAPKFAAHSWFLRRVKAPVSAACQQDCFCPVLFCSYFNFCPSVPISPGVVFSPAAGVALGSRFVRKVSSSRSVRTDFLPSAPVRAPVESGLRSRFPRCVHRFLLAFCFIFFLLQQVCAPIGSGAFRSGLTNSAYFFEIWRNLMDWGRSEFKNHRITVHCFKISEKDKNQQKIYKKLD
jgi:hypothetical protein